MEGFVAPELLQQKKDEDVDADERVIDDRHDRPVRIVVSDWEHNLSDSRAFRGL
jgi:hypothetical protein